MPLEGDARHGNEAKPVSIDAISPDLLAANPDLAKLSTRQLRYLATISRGSLVSEAAHEADIAEATVRGWRCYSPTFRAVEATLRNGAPNALYADVTKGMMARASPLVGDAVVTEALGEVKSDRQLSNRQRARETVLRVAGVLQSDVQPTTVNVGIILQDAARRRRELEPGRPGWADADRVLPEPLSASLTHGEAVEGQKPT